MVKARLGSERVKDKMTRPFAGTGLLEIALRKLLQCSNLDPSDIYLGAYDQEIKDIGKRVGVQIYNRSRESVLEGATMKDLYRFVWEIESPYFIEVNPCNPLLKAETIDRAIDVFQKNDYSSLFSVVKRQNFFFDETGKLISPFYGGKSKLPILDTKLVGSLFEAAHSIYIWNAARVKRELTRWTFEHNDPFLFEIPLEEYFDIDYPWQFEFAEYAYIQRKEKGDVS